MTDLAKPAFKRYDVAENKSTKQVLYCNPYLEKQLEKRPQATHKDFLEALQGQCNAQVIAFISKFYTIQNYEEHGTTFRAETFHIDITCGEPIMAAPMIVDRLLSFKGDKTKLNIRNGHLDFGQAVNEYGYLEFHIFFHGFWD